MIESADLTQIWAKAGLSDAKQYLPAAWLVTATMVIKTRIKQY